MPRFDWHKERWWVKLIAWAMLLLALGDWHNAVKVVNAVSGAVSSIRSAAQGVPRSPRMEKPSQGGPGRGKDQYSDGNITQVELRTP
jgi:hypothetical protein